MGRFRARGQWKCFPICKIIFTCAVGIICKKIYVEINSFAIQNSCCNMIRTIKMC